jgi:hypothetical protein
MEGLTFDQVAFDRILKYKLTHESFWKWLKGNLALYFFGTWIKSYVRHAVTLYCGKLHQTINTPQQDKIHAMREAISGGISDFIERLSCAYQGAGQQDPSTVYQSLPAALYPFLEKQEEQLLKERWKAHPRSHLVHELLYRPALSAACKEVLGRKTGFVAEWCFRRCISSPEAKIEGAIRWSLRNIRDPAGYAHPIHSFLLGQLSQLSDMLASPQPETPLTPLRAAVLKDVSGNRSYALSRILRQTLEVLNLADKPSRLSLRKAIQEHSSFFSFIDKGVSQGVSRIALQLADSTNAFLDKQKRLELTHDLFRSVNQLFVSVKETSPLDKPRVEKECTLKIQSIIRQVSRDVLRNTLGIIPSSEAAQAIWTIRDLSHQFAHDVDDLRQIYGDATISASSSIISILHSRLHECLEAYRRRLSAVTTERSPKGTPAEIASLARHIAHAEREIEEFSWRTERTKRPHFVPFPHELLEETLAECAQYLAETQTETLRTLVTDPKILELGPLHHLLNYCIVPATE